MPTIIRKIYTEESEEELLEMTRKEVTDQMADSEILFCEYYIRNRNIKTAAIKAGYKSSGAHIIGYKVRKKPLVNRYIAWLKLKVSNKCLIDASDIVEMYAKIAFADITDFVTIEKGRMRLKEADEIDGHLIKQIKHGKDGITVELVDRLSALDKLERYFDCMPADWKQKIEEQKLQLMRDKLEFEKSRAGGGEELGDDGFIAALKGSVEELWGEGE